MLATLVVSLALCAAFVAAPAQAALPGSNGKIAFTRAGEIWTMGPSGGNETKLTETGGYPAWSPDGTRIAFATNDGIWVMNEDGSNETLRYDTGYRVPDTPAWSPDGTRIAFATLDTIGNPSAIWVIYAKGKPRAVRLTSPTMGLRGQQGPTWSPDSASVAFSADSPNDPLYIFVVNVDKTGLHKVFGGWDYGPRLPDWSPDGSRIAFMPYGNDRFGLIDPSGGNLAWVKPAGTSIKVASPAFSPDGTKFAFGGFTGWDRAGRPTDGKIWTMGTDGSSPAALSTPPAGIYDWGPAWQPRLVSADPSNIDFGSHADHTESSPRTVTLTNHTYEDVAVSDSVLGGPDASSYLVRSDGCTGTTLTAGQACTLTVRFRPLGTGVKTATIEFTDDGAGSPQTVTLTGKGTPGPWLEKSPSSLGFGNAHVGSTSASKTVTLTNVGTAPMNITGISLGGANPGDYTNLSQTCTALLSLRAGRSCTASVAFRPTAVGKRPGQLISTHNAPRSPKIVPLQGSGT